jgi:hypothetical protein
MRAIIKVSVSTISMCANCEAISGPARRSKALSSVVGATCMGEVLVPDPVSEGRF